jgi:hypothetical protein
MASYMIDVMFADGDRVIVRAAGAASYPDALDELRAQVVEGFKESTSYLLAIQAVTEDEA